MDFHCYENNNGKHVWLFILYIHAAFSLVQLELVGQSMYTFYIICILLY